MGEIIARTFAMEGAGVVIADIDGAAAAGVAGSICSTGGAASAWQVDVTDDAQVERMFQETAARLGSVHILVNCAAITEFLPSEEIDAARWRRMIDVDLTGVFFCCREAGKIMIPQRRGKIINFGSTGGLAGIPYMAHYTAAKHAVIGLTKSLATEWGKYNINVNCICPGATQTPMLMNSTTPEYRAERIARTPLNRLATTEDQARVALFLASDDSDYVTGNMICTDGGIYALAASTSSSALAGSTFNRAR